MGTGACKPTLGGSGNRKYRYNKESAASSENWFWEPTVEYKSGYTIAPGQGSMIATAGVQEATAHSGRR